MPVRSPMFGLAPRASSSSTRRQCPLMTAQAERRRAHRDRVASRSAPASASAATAAPRSLARRVHQRRPSALRQDGLPDVGVALLERVADYARRRVRERRDRRAGVDVAPAADQDADGIGVGRRSPPTSARSSRAPLDGVGVRRRAASERGGTRRRRVPGRSREHQRRLTVAQRRIRRRASAPLRQQQLEQRRVAGAAASATGVMP